MVLELVLTGICLIFCIFKAYFANKKSHVIELILKTTASLLFVTIGLVSLIDRGFSEYGAIVVFAAVLGLVGDIFLSLKRITNRSEKPTTAEKLPSYFGILMFFMGHIVYAINMCSFTKFNYALTPVVFILPICFIIVSLTKIFSTTKAETIFLVFYYLAINIEIIGAVNILLAGYTTLGIINLIAALLFFISDSILGFRDHSALKINKNVANYAVMLTYYAAQCLYALSICFAV